MGEEPIQRLLHIPDFNNPDRFDLRLDVLKEYTGFTLSHEIMIEGKNITQTRLFKTLHGRYVHNSKKRVLEPFIDNANFRRAIKDFDTEDFKAHDKRIKRDVKFLINNLDSKFNYIVPDAQ